MKDFIQNRLRVLLEVVTNRDSDLNIPDIIKFGPSYVYSSADMNRMIATAAQIAMKMPSNVLPTSYGNGAYTFKLTETKSGYFTFVGVPTTKHFSPGEYKEAQNGKSIYLYTMACSKYPEGENESCTTIYNPNVDAKIKILTDPELKRVIMDFINKSLGYLDDKGAEIQASKMSPDQLEKLAGKKDLYAKRGAQEKGYFGDEEKLRKQLNDLVIARRNATSMEEKKKIRNQELELKNALANIEKERRNRLSTNR
jgi:hypothetical protein